MIKDSDDNNPDCDFRILLEGSHNITLIKIRKLNLDVGWAGSLLAALLLMISTVSVLTVEGSKWARENRMLRIMVGSTKDTHLFLFS